MIIQNMIIQNMVVWRGGLSEGFCQNQFNRKAARAKHRWFSSAIRRAEQNRKLFPNPFAPRLVCRFLWLVCGAVAVWMSWQLFLGTGELEERRTETIYRESVSGDGLESEAGDDLEPGELWKMDGWERELFGVQIRIRDGKITIFQDKRQVVEE